MDSRADLNQPPPLEDYNAFDCDLALSAALGREGGGWAHDRLCVFGLATGSAELLHAGALANEYPPRLRTHDRYGERIDEIEFHPAYHQLMRHAFASGMHSIAWTEQHGGHVAHAAMVYLMAQTETGVCCPAAMTYASVPSLRHERKLAEQWLPRILKADYDSLFVPGAEKTAVTVGMAMTEKQGGSDVRANRTEARPLAGGEYLLNGHKWFCSAPMSDAFLTLAQAEGGLSCFLVPRWLADGTRNRFFIQRLKDKCGNRANASAEIEYHDTWCQLIGAEGAGVRTIIDMVQHTRLDASLAPAGLMRQALVQAIHHARHRSAFGKPLARQPLMRQVLADMALEVEAALLLVMRVARAFDESSDEASEAFARIATAVAKFWVNKRTPNLVYEAMECLGGGGYVEESGLPRLYREAPLNSIWEGSGNVIALDILRALAREPLTGAALLAELTAAEGADDDYDAALAAMQSDLQAGDIAQSDGRRLAERLALLLQAGLMLRHAEPARARLFCNSRLRDAHNVFGTLRAEPATLDAILEYAWPL